MEYSLPLPPDFICGFVDKKGSFSLIYRRDIRRELKSCPVYYYWKASFIILLKKENKDILKKIKKTFNCGRIYTKKFSRYQVANLEELYNIIIPFFGVHLLSKKKSDFNLWTEAVKILYKHKKEGKKGPVFKKFNEKELKRLFEIQKLIEVEKKGKGKRNKFKWIPCRLANIYK